ncbi:hypothetical protein EPUL_006834, partial [Erysiphe pulchra]
LTFDDSDWISLFDEVKDSSPANSLRQTFASALAHSQVIDPQSIWDRFKNFFSDDCARRIQNLGDRLNPPPSDWTEEEKVHDYGLWLLGDNLRDLGLDWTNARLAGPSHDWTIREDNTLIANALNYNQEEERNQHAESISMFSPGQQQAYNTIISTVDTNIRPNTFFLQGPAGTGKTFLYKTLCNYYRSQGGIVLCVASSGIASLLLPGGSTAHSLFRIPIECTDSSRCHISRQTKLARLLTVTKLIIWDEVTMQNKHNFNAVDKTLRDLMNSDELFGGIPVVLGGDFARILPVVKRGQRQDIVNACIRYWQNWSLITPLFLTQNMRVVESEVNQQFVDWLYQLSYTHSQHGLIDLPDWIQTTDDRQFFRQFIYPGHAIQIPNSSFFLKRAILTSRNDAVDVFNREIGDLTNSESHDYFALDTAQNDRSVELTDYTSEFLQAISGKGIPLGKLSLRVGMPIMLL